MKNILAALFILFLYTSPCTAQQKTIIFAAGSSPDAYQSILTSAIMKEALARNGYNFKVEYYPSPRALNMSNSGKLHGELHRVYEFHKVSQGKYPNLIRIESELMTVHLAVFSNKDAKPISSWRDMKGHKLGYMRGRKNVQKFLETYLPNDNKIFPQSTDKGLFIMLARGRLDYIIAESYEGRRIVANNKMFKDIVEMAKLENTHIYAYMNAHYKPLAKIIAKTLDQMKADGSFDRISQQVQKKILIPPQTTD